VSCGIAWIMSYIYIYFFVCVFVCVTYQCIQNLWLMWINVTMFNIIKTFNLRALWSLICRLSFISSNNIELDLNHTLNCYTTIFPSSVTPFNSLCFSLSRSFLIDIQLYRRWPYSKKHVALIPLLERERQFRRSSTHWRWATTNASWAPYLYAKP
jgi:hypothetical protein